MMTYTRPQRLAIAVGAVATSSTPNNDVSLIARAEEGPRLGLSPRDPS
jgi:hypothetical protein